VIGAGIIEQSKMCVAFIQYAFELHEFFELNYLYLASAFCNAHCTVFVKINKIMLVYVHDDLYRIVEKAQISL